MADLKTVIAQLKAQQQASQQSKQAPVQAPVEAKEEAEDLLDGDDLDDPTGEVEEAKQVPVQEVPSEDKRRAEIEHQQAIEMELLQNNGRFRAEMLYQLQELNKALVVIAEILVKE